MKQKFRTFIKILRNISFELIYIIMFFDIEIFNYLPKLNVFINMLVIMVNMLAIMILKFLNPTKLT